MVLSELINKLEDILFETDDDPEVYINIGNWQTPVNGVKHFPEIRNVCWESVVISDDKKPNLII